MKKATNEQIIEAYRNTGSVWKAAKTLGMVGQSVWERLRALGYPLPGQNWTDEEIAELTALAATCTIGEIAHRLGRPYGGVAGKISTLRLGVHAGNRRPRKPPRGAGYDKATTLRRLRELERFDGSIRQFCRTHGLGLEQFVQVIQRYAPERWIAYVQTHSRLETKTCPYCGVTFHPMTGKQTFCTRQCAANHRQDVAHFDGHRRDAIGLAENVCQLCERRNVKGLSAHHLLGRENDPEHAALIALCPGCHHLIGMLAGRAFADSEHGWENLISIVLTRRARKTAGSSTASVYVTVGIERLGPEEVDEWLEYEATFSKPGLTHSVAPE